MAGLYTLTCPNCGAPLPKHARWTAVKCVHCGAVAAPGMQVVSRGSFRRALARAEREIPERPDDFVVAEARYQVLAPLAKGDRADVFLATRARALTERAVAKVLRDAKEAPALDAEWVTLEALHASTGQGAPHFTTRLPPLVSRGDARFSDGQRRPALVFRALPGFEATLADVRDAYPEGVDARHAVWMWRRVLELLGWVHRNGWAHGNVSPAQVVLDPREHGAILVGWSHAGRLVSGQESRAMSDLAMSAQSVLTTLGHASGEATPVYDLLHACAQEHLPATDAWDLMERVAEAARRAFGPPTFVPFSLPARRDGRAPRLSDQER